MSTLLAALLLVGCNSLTLVEYEVGGVESTTLVGSSVPVQLSSAAGAELFAPSLEGGPELQDGDLAEARFDAIVIDGNGADLSFLDAITISVASPGMVQEVVAMSEGPLVGAGPFELALTDVDLVPYFETGEISFPATLVGMTPEQDVELTVDWTVILGVTAQGVMNVADEAL